MGHFDSEHCESPDFAAPPFRQTPATNNCRLTHESNDPPPLVIKHLMFKNLKIHQRSSTVWLDSKCANEETFIVFFFVEKVGQKCLEKYLNGCPL